MNINTKAIFKKILISCVSTLIFVLLKFVQFPLYFAPNVSLQIQAVVLVIIAAMFGPKIGFFVGFLGHALTDYIFLHTIWWSWVIAEGLFGMIVGMFSNSFGLNSEKIKVHFIINFNFAQLTANLLSWVVIAPGLDILIYKENSDKVLAEGISAFTVNVIMCLILGTLFIISYILVKNTPDDNLDNKLPSGL